MAARAFPEPVHTTHRPDGSPSTYIPKSERTDGGHVPCEDRMPHPFRDEFAPHKETGEGQNR